MKHTARTSPDGIRAHVWMLALLGGSVYTYAFSYDARDKRGSSMRASYAHHLRHIRRQVPDILRRASL